MSYFQEDFMVQTRLLLLRREWLNSTGNRVTASKAIMNTEKMDYMCPIL